MADYLLLDATFFFGLKKKEVPSGDYVAFNVRHES